MSWKSLMILLILVLIAGCKLTGTITINGEPLPGVKVTLSYSTPNDPDSVSIIAVTDSNGEYQINTRSLKSHRYLIMPSLDGYGFSPAYEYIDIYWNSNEAIVADFEAYAAVQVYVPNEYATIQAAIDSTEVRDGSTIWIADGIYEEHDINFHDKVITIKSINGPENCIIDCKQQGGGFIMSQFGILNGITVINGSRSGISLGDYSKASISNCIIKNSSGYNGGGIVCPSSGSYPTISDCIIIGNTAVTNGGGIYTTGGVISNCNIDGNNAGEKGGGIYAGENATISNCGIRGNITKESGGGVYLYQGAMVDSIVSGNKVFVTDDESSCDTGEYNPGPTETCYNGLGGGVFSHSAKLNNCKILNNTATNRGGGIYNFNSTISNCIIERNISTRGGGIHSTDGLYQNCLIRWNKAIYLSDVITYYNKYIEGGGCYLKHTKLIDCIVSYNEAVDGVDHEGSGIFIVAANGGEEDQLTNCVITRNFGEGVSIYTNDLPEENNYKMTIMNCTIADNNGKSINIGSHLGDLIDLANPVEVKNNILWGPIYEGNTTLKNNDIGPEELLPIYKINNINEDPIFVHCVSGPYQLAPYSPCIDNAPNLGAPEFDILGVERPVGDKVDIGAYEWSAITGCIMDSDNDSLPDDLENNSCTDSNNPDTDNDGLKDGDEDANHNGIVDSGETDPCRSDTDADGMQDGWEVDWGFNPFFNDAGDDYDNDGISNLVEFKCDTNPVNKSIKPDIEPGPSITYEYDEFGRIKKIVRVQ